MSRCQYLLYRQGALGPKRMFGWAASTTGSSGALLWAHCLTNIWPAVPIAYVFNVLIKRRYLAWWSKYNHVTTTAFSAAIAICAIVIFFAMRWPGLGIYWRGNTRFLEGCDVEGCARLRIPDQGFFGPVGSITRHGPAEERRFPGII
ncbi:hypothetical protein C8J57DRAFT_1247157 [Mycena rebaudengoi]|nr:hypothetical protein C8J57DRAFT_1247157 [Mycena rebaudengoi]